MANDSQDMAALTAIENEIEQGTIRVYRNALNQPYVLCDHSAYPRLNVGLFHNDFRGWLCRFVREQKQLLLHRREVDRILQLLNGHSLEHVGDRISDPEILRVLEADPLFATIVEFMAERDDFEASVEELRRILMKFARERETFSRMSARFPGGANVLSRQLKSFTCMLEQLGIIVNIHRSNGAKVKLTKRKDDNGGQSSGESSALKYPKINHLDAVDDRTQRLRKLTDRKQLPRQNETFN